MQFQAFIEALAARSGQLFSVVGVSRDLGISTRTIKAWLSVLEATFQVFIVRPHFEKRWQAVSQNAEGVLCRYGDALLQCRTQGSRPRSQRTFGSCHPRDSRARRTHEGTFETRNAPASLFLENRIWRGSGFPSSSRWPTRAHRSQEVRHAHFSDGHLDQGIPTCFGPEGPARVCHSSRGSANPPRRRSYRAAVRGSIDSDFRTPFHSS